MFHSSPTVVPGLIPPGFVSLFWRGSVVWSLLSIFSQFLVSSGILRRGHMSVDIRGGVSSVWPFYKPSWVTSPRVKTNGYNLVAWAGQLFHPILHFWRTCGLFGDSYFETGSGHRLWCKPLRKYIKVFIYYIKVSKAVCSLPWNFQTHRRRR